MLIKNWHAKNAAQQMEMKPVGYSVIAEPFVANSKTLRITVNREGEYLALILDQSEVKMLMAFIRREYGQAFFLDQDQILADLFEAMDHVIVHLEDFLNANDRPEFSKYAPMRIKNVQKLIKKFRQGGSHEG